MTDWIGELINSWGYLAVGLLMFIETVFPPIPSEVIMPLAGVHAAQQGASLAGMILAGTIGAMAGNIFWFVLAWKLGLDRFESFLVRYGRVFTMDEMEIARGRALFEKYGAGFVGVGRILPTIRSLISVPAGLLHMRPRTFLVFSTLGTFLWTMGLAVAGYLLGRNFGEVDRVLGPLSTAVIVVCFLIYLYRVIMWNQLKARRDGKT
jgi:membrane protein DedA with SNARE-associated domain